MSGAARCSPCDMYYPYDRKTCPICEKETWHDGDGVYESDWKKQVERIQKETRFDPGQRIPCLDVPIVNITGEDWVAAVLLEAEGVPQEPGQVILIKPHYYELVEHRFLSDGKTKGGWLLHRFDLVDPYGVGDEGLLTVPVEWVA